MAGCDPDATNLRAALARGAIDEACGSPWPDRAVDALVIAAPVDAALAQVRAYVAKPPRAALVLDVGSVKAPIAAAATGLAAFVPTHPLAGSHRSGARAARADLFAGKTWTYDPAFAPAAVAAVRAFIAAMGALAEPVDSASHDRIVALTSHLPQSVSVALGALLAQSLDEPHVAALCGPGMRSMLRLGRSAWNVWEPVLRENAGPAAQEVRRLCAVLTDVAEALEAGETDDLAPYFGAAARAAARLPQA